MQATTPALCWGVSLWLLLIDNSSFWRLLWSASDQGSARAALALLALGAVLWCLLALVLRLVCWGKLTRPLLIFVLLVAALVAHFIGTYGVMVDKGMVRNALQTDWREASELLTTGLAWDLAWRGFLPALVVMAVTRSPRSSGQALAGTALHAAATAAVAASAVLLFYADYAALARNHREARHLLTPSNVANGLWGLYQEQTLRSLPIVSVAVDARRDARATAERPLIVVLVVGETARASSFSLAGYARPTNGALTGKKAVYLGSAVACGTDTATSLPCMFSDLGSDRFSVAQATRRENVLDVLLRAGVDVTWIENNSGCKGVCARVPTWQLGQRDFAACIDGQCFDEAFIDALKERLASSARSDALMVLHLQGSHGPAYYLRHPARCKHYQPTCETREIQQCSVGALRNSYDNTVTYTSEVLGGLIDTLQSASDRFDSVLLYVSDHGESLGEGGVFLHGLPKSIAPLEQTLVPMIGWASAATQRERLASAAAATPTPPLAHDHLFHTLLGAFQVQSEAYRRNLDLLAAPANAVPGQETAR